MCSKLAGLFLIVQCGWMVFFLTVLVHVLTIENRVKDLQQQLERSAELRVRIYPPNPEAKWIGGVRPKEAMIGIGAVSYAWSE